jgi:hypothetical protein
MTAAQLAHLAELSAYAADFFAITSPLAARTFSDAALRANSLSARLSREEQQARRSAGLTVVSVDMADGVTL